MAGFDVVAGANPPPPADKPTDPGYADYWVAKQFNARDTAGFDEAKPTATRDQFGEWSVDDANNSGKQFSPQQLEDMFTPKRKPMVTDFGAPAPKPEQTYALNDATIWGMKAGLNLKLSPVQEAAVTARLKGYSWDDFNTTLAKQVSDWRDQGYDSAAIGKTLGVDEKTITSLDTAAKMSAQRAKDATQPAGPENNDFWSNFTYGLTNQSSLSPWLPQQKAPQNPGFWGKMEEGLGQMIPSMGAYAAGSLLGGPWAGGTAGWMVDATMRAAIADQRANGALTSKDAAARIVGIAVEAAKDTAPVAVMGPAGEAGSLALKSLGVASKVASGAARTSAEAVAMVAAQSAVEGHIPTQEELFDTAIQLAILHGARLTAKGLKIGVKATADAIKGAKAPAEPAGGIEGSPATSAPGQATAAAPAGGPVPSKEEIASAYHALNQNWAATGEPYKLALARVAADDPAKVGHTDPAPVDGVFPTEEALAASEKAPRLPSWHDDPSGPHEATVADVRTELADPKVQTALSQPKTIDRTTDVPYGAGYTKDGSTILIDRHLPTSLKVGGRPFPTDHFIAIHEAVEKAVIDKYAKGWTGTQQALYLKGHSIATAVEHAQERAAGFDPKKVEDALAPFLKAEGSEKVNSVHPDIDKTPYTPTHQAELQKKIDAGTPASQSPSADYNKAMSGEGGGGRPVYDGVDLSAPPSSPLLPGDTGQDIVARMRAAAAVPKALKEATGKVSEWLYANGGRAKARKIEFLKWAATLPSDFRMPSADGNWSRLDEKMYDHMEQPEGVPLDEHEQALWDKYIQPLKDREQAARKAAAPYQSKPPSEEELLQDPDTYVHHIVQGEEPKSDVLKSGAPDLPQGEAKGVGKQGIIAKAIGRFRRLPPSTASSQRASTFYTITDGDNRHVVSQYPGDEAVHLWKFGAKQKAYGGLIKAVPKRVIPEHEVPGKTVTERPVVARVADADIKDENGKIITPKGAITEPYVKEGGKFVPDSMSKDRTIPEHYVRGELKPGNMFVDMNGKAWNIERSLTGEKEMHTAHNYQKSGIGNTVDNIVELEGAADTGKMLEDTKAALSAAGYMADAKSAPKGWATVNDWRFDGQRLHPDIANVFNDYIRGSPSAAKTAWFNRLAVGSMFALPSGLIAHAKNVFGQAWAAAGWDNLKTRQVIDFTSQAVHEVNTLGPDYMRLLSKGAALVSSDIPGWRPNGANDLNSVILKQVGLAVERSPEMKSLVEKLTGSTVGQSWMNGLSKELYRYNDMRYMKRYYQTKAAHPEATDEQIIKQVERSFPTYRIPSKIGGSRTLAQVFANRNIVQFGAYAISKYTTLFHNIADLVSPNLDTDSRGEAVGRLVFQAIAMTAGQWVLDQVAKHATGDPTARFLEGGIFGVTEDAFDFGGHLVDTALHPDQAHQAALMDDMHKNIGKLLSPATATWEALQQVVGLDFFTGKPIAEGGIAQQLAERGWHLAQNVVGTEVDAIDNLPKYIRQALGVSVTSPGAAKFNARQAATNAANAKAKAKTDPALLRGIYQHFGG